MEGVTAAQLKAIYLARATHWSELGGSSGQIVAVNKAAGRATLDVFAAFLHLAPPELTGDVIIGENEQAIKMVVANPGAIAYVSIGTARQAIASGAPLRLVTVAGVAATTGALGDGRYPLRRPLNIVSNGAPSPLARRFLEFAASSVVDDLIHELDFIPPAR